MLLPVLFKQEYSHSMFKFLRDLMMALIIIKLPSLLTLPPCIGIHNSKRKQSLSSVVKENFFKLLLSKVNCESAGRGVYFRQCNPNECAHFKTLSKKWNYILVWAPSFTKFQPFSIGNFSCNLSYYCHWKYLNYQ